MGTRDSKARLHLSISTQVCGTRGRPGIGVVLSECWPPPALKLPQNVRRWLLLPVLGAASTASILMLDQGRGCHGKPIAEGQNTDVEPWMGSFSCCSGITKGQNTDVEPWRGSSLCFLGTGAVWAPGLGLLTEGSQPPVCCNQFTGVHADPEELPATNNEFPHSPSPDLLTGGLFPSISYCFLSPLVLPAQI